MMKATTALVLFLAAAPAFPAAKPCEELKSEIAAKLEAKGVKNYQLEVVAAGEVKDQTVVGTCEGATKKITYAKEAGAAPDSGPKSQSAPKSPAKK